jgi:hypothetical protein
MAAVKSRHWRAAKVRAAPSDAHRVAFRVIAQMLIGDADRDEAGDQCSSSSAVAAALSVGPDILCVCPPYYMRPHSSYCAAIRDWRERFCLGCPESPSMSMASRHLRWARWPHICR